MNVLEDNERVEALREQKLFNDNQQAVLESAQRLRDWEYRAAQLSDIRYWFWLGLVVALLAGSCGWWIRGNVGSQKASEGTGILSTTETVKQIQER